MVASAPSTGQVWPIGEMSPNTTESYSSNLSAGTTVVVTHNLNTKDVAVSVYKISDNVEVDVPFTHTSVNTITLNSAVDLAGHRVVVLASGAQQLVGDVPAGGTTDQVLAKTSSVDYETGWVDASSGTIDQNVLNAEPYIRWFGTGLADSTTVTTSITGPGDTAFDGVEGSGAIAATTTNTDISLTNTVGNYARTRWDHTGNKMMLYRFDIITPSSWASSSVQFMQVRDVADVGVCSLSFAGTGGNPGRVRLLDSSLTTNIEGSVALSVSTRYTFQVRLYQNTTYNDLRVNIYQTSTGSLIESISTTTLAKGSSGTPGSYRTGVVFYGSAYTLVVGNIAYQFGYDTTATNAEITFMDEMASRQNVALYLPLSGGTLTGLLNTPATTTSSAGLRLPHGTAPTSPTDGDLWTTTAGLYARINAGTVGPLASTAYVIARTPQITVASSAPGSPSTNDLWVDTT